MSQIKSMSKWVPYSLLILICSLRTDAQNIEVNITGIRSDQGQILLDIYTDEISFEHEQPFLSKIFDKNEITDGDMIVRFNLDPGFYGFTLIDDENENGKMDYQFVAITKEGFAFSNFYLSGFKRPRFDDFKFAVEKGQNQTVIMKIRYMQNSE